MKRMPRREFLGLAASAALASAGASSVRFARAADAPAPTPGPAATSATAPAPAGRPNVLLINLDDLKANAIAALGNGDVKTPNLDALVARGRWFPRAYTMGSMVGAVCLPSRTMMLTGRSLFRIGGRGGGAPAAAAPGAGAGGAGAGAGGPIPLPTPMRAAGYETFHMGKGGNECKVAIEAFDHNIVSDDRGEGRAGSSQRHADRTIEFLRSRKAGRPFFIYLAPPVPHDPRLAPKEFTDLYDPAKITLPVNYLPQHPFDNGDMTVRDERLAPWPRTPEIIRRHLADYYACVSCADHHIGRILNALKDLGQLDNTVVILIGDNGLSLGDHGLMGKQNLYEFGGMHVPMVVAGPGIPPGRSDAFVYLMDLYPTICDFGGAAVPDAVEGKSLLPILQGKLKSHRDVLYTAYQHGQRSVRDDRWKLIRYPLVDKTQLFDLANDPRELTDLSARPEHAAKAAELMTVLEKQQQLWADKSPLKAPTPKPATWTPPTDKPGKAARKKKKE